MGIITSLLFPLLHIQFQGPRIPSLSQIIPTFLLPEITITAEGQPIAAESQRNVHSGWYYFQWIYSIGLLFFLIRFLTRLLDLILTLKNSTTARIGNLKVVELEEEKPTCSFFNVIVLGRANALSEDEKQKILRHESVHAKQLHSFDILLINLLGIFFWFNPLLKNYKKIFVQLHEFEADARAVENHDVNEYCNLLARVALESAGFKLANHFNNSLTLKRIEMMRTIKRKIKPWKMLVTASIIPLVFFIIACQDQVMNEVSDIAKSSTMAIDIPEEVQTMYDKITKANPDKKYLLMETDENMKPKLDEMKSKLESLDQSQIGQINLITPTVKPSDDVRTFAIIEYTESMNEVTNRSKLEDDVYVVVEETASPRGGMPEFYNHIAHHLKYPAQARRMGIEGKVFVEFIVQTDGSITDLNVKKGIGAGCDQEAMRAIQSSPNWIPGKNKGVVVKQRMVLPISFKLSPSNLKDETSAPKDAMEEMVVVGEQ
jgi:TonB family protein